MTSPSKFSKSRHAFTSPLGLWLAALAVVAVALITIGVIFLTREGDTGVAEMAGHEPDCDLQAGPCTVMFSGGGEVELEIGPRPIKGATPFQIQVATRGIEANGVQVDFRGLGMDMGYNRPALTHKAAGSYAGNGMLSVCVTDRMFWQATVLLDTERGILAAPFRFDVTRH